MFRCLQAARSSGNDERPGIMNMTDVYLRTTVFAEHFDEHGCSPVRVFSKELTDL
ncbi:MAG: hypothetical protein RBT80_18810 [Candidatus Vecturithrix sp.]|nr:hypothetical protein [Candidatus Vecturithrix sp.]